jgi:hypothetical protein
MSRSGVVPLIKNGKVLSPYTEERVSAPIIMEQPPS